MLGYGESIWQIPLQVLIQEITIVAQMVYDKMSPCPEIIASKDVNLAGGG